MRNILYLGAFALVAASVAGCNDSKKAKNYNQKTEVDDIGLAFIKKATEAGNTEIKAGNLAESKSKNPRVLAFAKMIINDHTTAGNQLKTIADNKYVTFSDTLTQEHNKMISDLGALNGPAFDKTYMQMMITDHNEAITLYKDVSNNKNKTLQDYANNTLPKLMVHLDSAKAINNSIK